MCCTDVVRVVVITVRIGGRLLLPGLVLFEPLLVALRSIKKNTPTPNRR